jgi:hypothetical protein
MVSLVLPITGDFYLTFVNKPLRSRSGDGTLLTLDNYGVKHHSVVEVVQGIVGGMPPRKLGTRQKVHHAQMRWQEKRRVDEEAGARDARRQPQDGKHIQCRNCQNYCTKPEELRQNLCRYCLTLLRRGRLGGEGKHAAVEAKAAQAMDVAPNRDCKYNGRRVETKVETKGTYSDFLDSTSPIGLDLALIRGHPLQHIFESVYAALPRETLPDGSSVDAENREHSLHGVAAQIMDYIQGISVVLPDITSFSAKRFAKAFHKAVREAKELSVPQVPSSAPIPVTHIPPASSALVHNYVGLPGPAKSTVVLGTGGAPAPVVPPKVEILEPSATIIAYHDDLDFYYDYYEGQRFRLLHISRRDHFSKPRRTLDLDAYDDLPDQRAIPSRIVQLNCKPYLREVTLTKTYTTAVGRRDFLDFTSDWKGGIVMSVDAINVDTSNQLGVHTITVSLTLFCHIIYSLKTLDLTENVLFDRISAAAAGALYINIPPTRRDIIFHTCQYSMGYIRYLRYRQTYLNLRPRVVVNPDLSLLNMDTDVERSLCLRLDPPNEVLLSRISVLRIFTNAMWYRLVSVAIFPARLCHILITHTWDQWPVAFRNELLQNHLNRRALLDVSLLGLLGGGCYGIYLLSSRIPIWILAIGSRTQIILGIVKNIYAEFISKPRTIKTFILAVLEMLNALLKMRIMAVTNGVGRFMQGLTNSRLGLLLFLNKLRLKFLSTLLSLSTFLRLPVLITYLSALRKMALYILGRIILLMNRISLRQ